MVGIIYKGHEDGTYLGVDVRQWWCLATAARHSVCSPLRELCSGLQHHHPLAIPQRGQENHCHGVYAEYEKKLK